MTRANNSKSNTIEITMIFYESDNDNNDADNTNVMLQTK